MTYREYCKCTRIIDLKYILQGSKYYTYESEENPISYISDEDYFETDLIEKTSYVKRLARSYTEDSHLIEEPFVFKLTKACRTTLQEIQNEPKLFHIQDTVQFYEAITYFPKKYNNLPEPAYTEIKHIRDLSKPVRRKVFSDQKLHKRRCTHSFVQIHGTRYLNHWVDQHKRDPKKYKEGHGILLLPATPSEARDNYWNSLVSLRNIRIPYDEDETKLRLLSCAYLTLRHKYPSNVQEFYLNTTHQQYLPHYELSIPVLHTPVILRSISNGLTTVFISNRAPNYFSDSNPLKTYQLKRRRSTILQATRQELNNSIGFTRARIGLAGISHGTHTHFEPYLEAQVPWSRRKSPLFERWTFY
jgi:hypothetical protein